MKMVDRLVVKLIADGAIEEEDKEIYEYGFTQGITMIVNILCTILIGICMNMLAEDIIFMITYIPLRSYAGGFHAKTKFRCFIYSNLLVVLVLGLIKFLAGYTYFMLVAGIIGAGCVIFLAPVEDQNKPLDEKEVEVYGKKARRMLLLDIVFAGILKFLSFDRCVTAVLVSICTLSVILVMGYIKNILLKHNLIKRNEDE